MNKAIICLLLTFNLFFQVSVIGQQRLPVRTITNVSAPYPVSLEQFVAVDNGKISLRIIPNDIKLQNYSVKLKLVISGGWFTITSNPSFLHRSITLNNGEIQSFSGADLAEWFNPDNLLFEGYSKSQYLKNGRLPEGMYQVWFEVYEMNYGYNMSTSTKAMVWLFENDPPLLNFPANAKEFIAADPQNIVFNWTLRQSPFSVAGSSNDYKFELWEVWPDNMNVEEVVRTTRPIYSNTVNSNTFTYTAGEPLLLPGRKYVWRVQATDAEGKKQYKNDGYSEVRWFRYGKDCGVPVPQLGKVTDNSISLKWENDYRFDKYELRWRNKNRKDGNWYSLDGDRQGAVLTKLAPNSQFEIQVHGFCGVQDGEYSSSIVARTKEETVSACGVPMGSIDLSSQDRLPSLKSGDFFHASDFDVQVYQVSGANGTFSGKGFVSVPLLKSIKFEAEFKGIKINTDYRLYDGEVKFIYNPKNGISVNFTKLLEALTPKGSEVAETNPYTGIADRKASTDTSIASITIRSTGEIIAEKADGRTEVIRASTGEMVAVSGKTEGSEQYVVDTQTGTLYKGTPERKGSNSSSGSTKPLSTNSAVKYRVSFEPHSSQLFGLDLPGESSPAAVYRTNSIGGKDQNTPWKSVAKGQIDRLLAKVEGGQADSVHYLTESNNLVMTSPGTDKNTCQMLVTGVEKSDELKAWYPERVNDSTENRILAGQVNIVAYDKQLVNLCLVEVNGGIAPNADFVERELNSIYAPAVVQWKVKKQEGFKVTITGLTDGVFVNKRADDKMDYTDPEKQVRSAFIGSKDYDKATVYLFFIGGKTSNAIKGFMPFNRQFGFVFCEHTSATDIIHTIAHEAGHGTFRLKHPYESTDARMASDNNLMAYGQSTRLYKGQWDECHDRDWGINWFENGDEGEESFSSEIAKKLRFVIGKDEFANNESYYTIYNNKEIEVKIEKADTSVMIDLTKIKWKLAGKEIASKDKLPNILAFDINATTLPKFNNDLLVLDSLGKTIIKLKIKTYYAPIVRFEEGSRFNGEYFFDKGYEFTTLASPTYYDTIQVGKNKETYYAPVLGLNQDQSATIKVKIDGFTDNVLNDKEFKIVFKPELAGKVTINGLDSLVLDAMGLDNLNDITIKAVNSINQDVLTPMSIKVCISSTRDKVGMLKYYCAQKVVKTVTLIYTKLKDESSFPSYLMPNGLSQFLNNNSLNQFFLNVTVDSIHFTSKRYEVAIMNNWGNTQIIDSLNSEKFGVKHGVTPTGYSIKDDYFYITNLERLGSSPGTHLGGFHWPGNPGGVQVKYIATQYNESAEELTAHELGHWLGLPHTFEKNTHVPVIVEPTQGGTKDNFMDYNVRRERWLHIQLIKYERY